MIKYEFVFRDNIAIIRDIETGEEVLHQPLRPTWGEPERWTSEEEAREWMYSHFAYHFQDVNPLPEPPPEPDPIDNTSNPTPGA